MTLGKIPHSAFIKFFAAFLFVSLLLNFDYPATPWFSWQLIRPSVDCWLLLILPAFAACRSKRILFWTIPPIYTLFLIFRVIRIGDTVVPMYLNRPLNLYIDSGYLFSLYDLLNTSSREEDVFLLSAVALAVGLGFIASSWFAWRAAANTLLDKPVRIAFLVLSGLLVSAAFFSGWHPAETPSVVRLYQEAASARHQRQQQQAVVARMEKTARDRQAEPVSLKGLEGADVLLFMVESYGRIVFSRPEYKTAMTTTMTSLARVLDRHGFMAVSSYLVSPAFGGISRLAHGTVEFRLPVKNDLEYTALMRSSLTPLAAYFRKTGYRTVSVMPGTRFAYPEGSRFGYEQVYYAWHFNYKGPAFGWAPMSDQFVLDYVHRREFSNRRQPLFVRYVLISTHAAFNIQPPFIAEWDTIGDGGIYNVQPPIQYPIHWPDLQNAGNAYLRSLDYEFTTLGDYLAKYVKADTLIIIMGDHQPNQQLTGASKSWSVPVHIISRKPGLLAPFRKRGYTPGLTPAQLPPHDGMETFFQGFLQDFR